VIKDFFVLELDGISIVGQSFLPDDDSGYPSVCLCHGVPSGNAPEPGDGGYPELAERFCHEYYPVFFFNFRGAGDSGGNLDMPGWTRDLQAVADYILGLDTIRSDRLYLVGFSGGAAASVYVALKNSRISGVAACACPADFSLFQERGDAQTIVDNYRTIGAIRDPDFPESAQAWLDSFKSVTPEDHVAGIAPRPLLIVHGSEDDIVPVSHAHRLFEKAGEPKKMVIVNGAGHRLRREPEVIRTVLDWLRQIRG
jgi:pimeloyl-ACP methyl ester carboxylesterase